MLLKRLTLRRSLCGLVSSVCNFGPEIKNDSIFWKLISNSVDSDLVVIFDRARWFSFRDDDDIAVIGNSSFGNRNGGRRFWKAFLWHDVIRVERAHPLASWRRHSGHRRIKAVEMPMLLAEITGDDSPFLGKRSCETALVAQDRTTKLVFQAESISIFLSNSSSCDLGGRSVLVRVDEVSRRTSRNILEEVF